MIRVKRVYDEADPNDGFRVLVDGLWPRGIRKEEAKVDKWLRDVSPSPELRRWFSHDPNKWEEFKRRYWTELDSSKQDTVSELVSIIKGNLIVTILYSAKDPTHNNAIALVEYLRMRGLVRD